MSAALEAFHGAIEGDAAYDAAKKPIRRQIKAARKKVSSKLYNLRQQLRDDSEIEYLRQAGELLLAYQYQIAARQTEFSAQYDPEGDPIKIKLNPDLTPLENAQRYFEKYEKAKRSRDRLPELIKDTRGELFYIDQLATDLDLASNWTEIGEVQDALLEGGYWKGKKRRLGSSGKSSPLKVVAADGTVIWIGRSSSQNEEVTFKKGSPDDLWLHARGVPGSHVIVKTGGHSVGDDTLDYAASLAVYFSKLRRATSGEVIVTERKHIRKIPGGKPGMVRISKESYPSMSVVPRSPEKE